MKFSDIFLPKIARSDPAVRKDAVQKEENIQLLKKVIENDSDREVRDLARQRVAQLEGEAQ